MAWWSAEQLGDFDFESDSLRSTSWEVSPRRKSIDKHDQLVASRADADTTFSRILCSFQRIASKFRGPSVRG